MTTRERKRLTIDSPTPTSGSDSTPVTPTGAKKRGRRSTCQMAQTIDIDIKQEKLDAAEIASAAVATTSTTSAESSKSAVTETAVEPRTPGRKRQAKQSESTVKEEEEPEETPTATTDASSDDTKLEKGDKPNATSSSKSTATPPVLLPTKRSSRISVGLVSRRSFPVAVRRPVSARRANSLSRVEKKEEPSLDEKSLRSGRQRKISLKSPELVLRKRKKIVAHEVIGNKAKQIKLEEEKAASDSELSAERNRSDSISKNSDVTDSSSVVEAADDETQGHDSTGDSPKNAIEPNKPRRGRPRKAPAEVKIKDEPVDISEKEEFANKDDEETNESEEKDTEVKEDAEESSTDDKMEVEKLEDETAVLSDDKELVDDEKIDTIETKDETDEEDAKKVKEAELKEPLIIDTTVSVSNSTPPLPENISIEKAASLSPELVAEGVSESSVKEFCGQPAFLENNLGIEKDPKLGEIVQSKEKLPTDDISEEITSVESTTDKEPKNVKDNPTEKEDVADEMVSNNDEQILPAEEKIDEAFESTKQTEKEEEKEDTDMKNIASAEIVETNETDKLNDSDKEIMDVDEPAKNKLSVNGNESEQKDTESSSENDEEKAKNLSPIDNMEVEDENKVEELPKEPKRNESDDVKLENKVINNGEKEESEDVTDETIVIDNKQIEIEDKENMKEQEVQKNIVGVIDPKIEEIKEELKSSTAAKDLKLSPKGLKEKESLLKTLGLLTHQAAIEAKEERQKHREALLHAPSKSGKNGKNGDYTGTLKTVIKLNRGTGEKRKIRAPLKMTFQKGRGRPSNGNNGKNDSGNTAGSGDKESSASANSEEENYYTIQNESDNASEAPGPAAVHVDGVPASNATTEGGKGVSLVIPEKASSFSIHPERVCLDQCFYCGGKFGLFDTPCHVAQIKSLDRQKKILDSEEKLTKDNCLCDACFRHVDRRANNPSYKKRLSAPSSTETLAQANAKKAAEDSKSLGVCQVTDCQEMSSHTLRRKWFLKMKKSLCKLITLKMDTKPMTVGLIPMCDAHYDTISHFMVCALCKRKLLRNHIFYITKEIPRLESLILSQGIPVVLGSTPVVCKLCRYYANLVLKPPEGKSQRAVFVKTYRNRLLQFHNIDAEESEESDVNVDEIQPAKRARSSGKSTDQSSIENNDKDSNDSSSNLVTHTSSGGQIMLDNDVLVGYDNPMMEASPSPQPVNIAAQIVAQQQMHQQQQQQLQQQQQQQQQQQLHRPKTQSLLIQNRTTKEDISQVLRGNPNISMRELFPGEEEMGLTVHIPYGNGGVRTPEGWTRVQTTIQYDEPTRHLFEELQKPYGNQSSFMRHLILLEKYFRNGDLILSQHASDNAVTYAETVQSRLRSYDNTLLNGSVSIYQMDPISVVPTSKLQQRSSRPTEQTPSISGSLLKNSQQTSSNERRRSDLDAQSNYLKQQQLIANANKMIPNDETSIIATNSKRPANLPPELICIKTNQPPPLSQPNNSLLLPTNVKKTPPQLSQIPPAQSQPVNNQSATTGMNYNNQMSPSKITQHVIKLPDKLTPDERLASKSWRPTLMPVSSGSASTSGPNSPLYQTADGRRLPKLVQVQSGGKPYLISIHDYNRMCILRREKLVKEQMNSTASANMDQPQPSTSRAAAAAAAASANEFALKQALINSASHQTNRNLQIPNKILEQNSVIPVPLNSNRMHIQQHNMQQQQQQHHQQQQLHQQQLQMSQHNESKRKSNPSSLLKSKAIPIAPKPMPQNQHHQNMMTPTISAVLSLARTSNQHNPIPSTSSGYSSQHNQNNANHHNPNSIWLWADGVNGGTQLDSSAASLLSKIPSSLTVIPQQKGRTSSRSSGDDGV